MSVMRFSIPRDIIYGDNALEHLSQLKGHKAVLVTGGSSMQRFGFLDRAEALLHQAGMSTLLVFVGLVLLVAIAGGVSVVLMMSRQREAELIGDITHVVMRRGQRARELLESNRHLLPVTPDADSLLSLELKDAVVPGLIEPAARDTAWAYEFGRRLARAIESELRTKWDMPLAGSAVEQIARWIEEAVR